MQSNSSTEVPLFEASSPHLTVSPQCPWLASCLPAKAPPVGEEDPKALRGDIPLGTQGRPGTQWALRPSSLTVPHSPSLPRAPEAYSLPGCPDSAQIGPGGPSSG